MAKEAISSAALSDRVLNVIKEDDMAGFVILAVVDSVVVFMSPCKGGLHIVPVLGVTYYVHDDPNGICMLRLYTCH